METILLVDDEGSVRGLARLLLEESGYRVLEASHASEALQICRRHEGPIDLLLTDLMMPGASGSELAERASPLRPGMKILYMSGSPSDERARRQIIEEAHPFLEKPFTEDSLVAAVRETIAGARNEQGPPDRG